MSATLGQLLGAVVRETGMAGPMEGPAASALRAAVQGDSVLAERARIELGALDPAVMMRDHISRWKKRALEHALGA